MAYLQQLDDWMSDQAQDPEVSPIQAVRNGLLSLITKEFNSIPMLRAEYELLLAASSDAKLAEAVSIREAKGARLMATALEQAGVPQPNELALTLINFTRGFELERLYKPSLSVDDFYRRLDLLLAALRDPR